MEARSRRRAVVTAAVMVAVMGAPAAQALPFLHFGVDAARTGSTADPGPVSIETVAFNTTLDPSRPAAVPWATFPVILDGAALTLQSVNPLVGFPSMETTGTEPGPAWIDRVELATATNRELVRLGDSVIASALASDGERLFVAVDNEVRAYDAGSGEPVWPGPYTVPTLTTTPPLHVLCNPPAVAEGVLFLPCHQVGGPNPGGSQWFSTSRPFVVALDAATGAEHWFASLEPHGATPGTGGGAAVQAMNYSPGGLTVGGGRVFVTVRGFPATAASTESDGVYEGAGALYGLDIGDGHVVWERALSGLAASASDDPLALDPLSRLAIDPRQALNSAGSQPALLYSPEALYVKQLDLEALDPATGEPAWSLRLLGSSEGAFDDHATGHALAMFADRLFATAFGTVYAIEARTHVVAWETGLPQGEDWAGVAGMVVAGGRLYALANSGRVFSFDIEDGGILEQRLLEGGEARFGVGDGVLVALAAGGRVIVLGKTPASIQPGLALADEYPAPGEAVTLDLSATRPGVLDPAVEARVDWGDGTLVGWTGETAFSHAYVGPGDRTIEVLMRNAAGQEAKATAMIHVGGTPPETLNFAQEQFEPANQDRTFFLLGLLITAIVAVIGATRLRRRRSRLQRELAAIETVFSQAKGDPVTAEAALTERRAHMRGLLADGQLDAAEAAVLERRIDELGASVRLEAIDDRFPFLPVGMARTLREMLADGRIQRWEREHFLAALETDGYLTASQKASVRRQIEEWFRADAGAGRDRGGERRVSR